MHCSKGKCLLMKEALKLLKRKFLSVLGGCAVSRFA